MESWRLVGSCFRAPCFFELIRLQLPQLVDSSFLNTFESESKNLGILTALWLSHILSQSPRQSRHLRSWITSHPETLRRHAPTFAQGNNASDVYLREILNIFANDRYWAIFETALNRRITQQYDLKTTRVRLEDCSALWYINTDGSLQLDNERRWRSGTSYVHMVCAILEPSNIPLTMSFRIGNEQTSDLALELVNTIHTLLVEPLIFVGNGALSNNVRAAIIQNKDHYLGLLSKAELTHNFADLSSEMQLIFQAHEQSLLPIAEACERHVQFRGSRPKEEIFEERQVYVRRYDVVMQEMTALRERVQMVCNEIILLTQPKRGKRRLLSLEDVHRAAIEICVEHGVEGLVEIKCQEDIDARTIRRYRGRPTTTRVNHMFHITAQINEQAFAQRLKELGWSVYVTSLETQALTFHDLLVNPVKSSPLLQRLNNCQLSLLPGVIQRPEHMRGIVRLLTLAIRCLALLDYASSSDCGVAGFQEPGASGEEFLRSFHNLTLTTVYDGRHEHRHLTALSTRQRRILDMLGLPYSLYQI